VKRVVVLEEAAEDLKAARDFYERIEEGVGRHFIAHIIQDIAQLETLHGIHSRHFGFHRMLASRFPFGIYYRGTETEAQVFAILDLRRDPTWLRVELLSRNP